MSIRYSLLSASIVVIGLCFFAANRASDLGIYTTAALTGAIVAGTITAMSLALFSLKSMSVLFITRAIIPVLIVIVVMSDNPFSFVNAMLWATVAIQAFFYSEKIISRCTRDIGNAGEDMFTLTTPLSVSLWFFFTWSVVWATFVECIHLFGSDHSILGIIAAIFGLIIAALFIAPQLRSLLRRCVIVPHGIVVSDPITLTDVVLLPLSKIKSIELVEKIDTMQDIPESTFASITKPKNVVAINLNDFTDSLIVRKNVGETERRNVNRLIFSVADAQNLVSYFHNRFHKIEPEELSVSQEKMIEKELGIETAPRSDAKLPQHRIKKKK